MKTINWQGSPNFKNNDTFLSLAGSTTAYQSRQQCSSGKWVIAPSVPAAILLEITWNMNHVDLFFFFVSPIHARLSRGTPFVFWRNMGRGALKLSEKTKKERRKGRYYWSLLSFGIKSLYVLEQRLRCLISKQWKVAALWGRNPTAPSLKPNPVKPAASSHRFGKITSFQLPPLHQQSNHSRLSGNRGSAVTSTWREGAPIIPPLLWWMVPGYDSRSRTERRNTERSRENRRQEGHF